MELTLRVLAVVSFVILVVVFLTGLRSREKPGRDEHEDAGIG